MKATFTAIAIALTAISTPVLAECLYPRTPDSTPNGNTATEAEMVAGMQAYKKYDAAISDYLKCLDEESNARILAAGEDQDQIKKIKAMAATRHNAAVDEAAARADEFNKQLRAFKKKQKG